MICAQFYKSLFAKENNLDFKSHKRNHQQSGNGKRSRILLEFWKKYVNSYQKVEFNFLLVSYVYVFLAFSKLAIYLNLKQ